MYAYSIQPPSSSLKEAARSQVRITRDCLSVGLADRMASYSSAAVAGVRQPAHSENRRISTVRLSGPVGIVGSTPQPRSSSAEGRGASSP